MIFISLIVTKAIYNNRQLYHVSINSYHMICSEYTCIVSVSHSCMHHFLFHSVLFLSDVCSLCADVNYINEYSS